MTNKLITTIMPVHNGESFIAEAIESVLNQTLPSDEIIIVNDGSTDKTSEILKNYPSLKVISQKNMGTYYALNEAISLASSKYLNFIDADDLWHPDKNLTQIKFMENSQNIDMLFCYMQQFNNVQKVPPQPGLLKLCCLVEKKKFDLVGKFNLEVNASFLLWFQKAQLIGLKYHCLPEVLAYRRIHENNLTANPKFYQDLTTLAKRLIAQKRNLREQNE